MQDRKWLLSWVLRYTKSIVEARAIMDDPNASHQDKIDAEAVYLRDHDEREGLLKRLGMNLEQATREAEKA